jgi:hypothetical protein
VISRVLVLAGAAATILSAFLTWVTVDGPVAALDLGLIGVDVRAADRVVAGTDTVLWPAVLAAGAIAALLGLVGTGRAALVATGVVTTVAGGLLLVYVMNVIEYETRDMGRPQREVARTLLDSTVGPGTPLLLAGGMLILFGGLAARRARA